MNWTGNLALENMGTMPVQRAWVGLVAGGAARLVVDDPVANAALGLFQVGLREVVLPFWKVVVFGDDFGGKDAPFMWRHRGIRTGASPELPMIRS